MHILSNISRSKANQTMRFGQLIEYNVRNIFLQKSGKETSSRGKETSSRALLVFLKKKGLYEVRASDLQLSFNVFR